MKNMQQKSDKRCETVFLDDAPIDTDELAPDRETSPHEKLAETIADLVLSSSGFKPRMIALEGSWGSGKSTVISMLDRRLQVNEKVTIFPFDAWAHEGDPLRRTFLESLIRHFLSKNWVANKPWEAELSSLANQLKHSRIKTVRSTTRFGRFVAISAFLIPIGAPLLSEGLRQGLTFDLTHSISWLFVFGLILTSAPALVALLKFFSLLPKLISGKASREDWAFLSKDESAETTQETIDSPEPTSIEFEDMFRHLLSEVFDTNRERHVIIVLDNLDRVDSKTALSVWSTLQIFLRFNSQRLGNFQKNLFIIVPYDRNGLLHLWENRNSSLPRTDAATGIPTESHEISAESFLEKSFQIRFQVPPIVLSNWKKYLLDKSKQALPSHSPESLDVIYQVFNAYRGPTTTPPTPRELKLYVNQIGAVHKQWMDTFPLGHIAYFVLLCRDGHDVRQDLLQGNCPDKAISYLIPLETSLSLSTSLSAMWFNVPPLLGQQMLLSEPIAQALQSKDSESLMKVFNEDSEAFWAILEQVAQPFLANETMSIKIANAAACLYAFGILDYPARLESQHVITYVKSAVERITQWSPFGVDIANGLAAACRLIADKNFCNSSAP